MLEPQETVIVVVSVFLGVGLLLVADRHASLTTPTL